LGCLLPNFEAFVLSLVFARREHFPGFFNSFIVDAREGPRRRP
jgi:hypothetical protein